MSVLWRYVGALLSSYLVPWRYFRPFDLAANRFTDRWSRDKILMRRWSAARCRLWSADHELPIMRPATEQRTTSDRTLAGHVIWEHQKQQDGGSLWVFTTLETRSNTSGGHLGGNDPWMRWQNRFTSGSESPILGQSFMGVYLWRHKMVLLLSWFAYW